MQRLAALLEDDDLNIRSRAASALVSLAQSSPQNITPEIVQRLIEYLEDDDFDIRYSAEITVGWLAQSSPQSITQKIVQRLVELLQTVTLVFATTMTLKLLLVSLRKQP